MGLHVGLLVYCEVGRRVVAKVDFAADDCDGERVGVLGTVLILVYPSRRQGITTGKEGSVAPPMLSAHPYDGLAIN